MKKFILIVIALTCFSSKAFSQEAPGVGTLSYVEGRVDRAMLDSIEYSPVVRDEIITEGQVIRTKSNSRAELTFNDGSVIRLAENTQLHVREYTFDASARKNASFLLDRGKLRAIVTKSVTGQPNFKIDTPNVSGAIRGSDICVSYEKSVTNVLAISGEYLAQSLPMPDKNVLISKGNTAALSDAAENIQARNYLPIEQSRFERETGLGKVILQKPGEDLSSKAIITQIAGSVRILSAGAAKWHPAANREALSIGDKIETGEDGYIEFIFESGREVTMKPGSFVTIDKILSDPKTGDREDLLTADRGQVRVRLEKLNNAKSKFEVKTPTAIAAVRGTVVYLNISNNSTKAYFEAGHGTLRDLQSRTEIIIGLGQNGSSSSGGKVEGPFVTPETERESLDKGWDIKEVVYGYVNAEDGAEPADTEEGADKKDSGEPAKDFSLKKITTASELFDEIPTEQKADKEEDKQAFAYGSWSDPGMETSLYLNDGGYWQHAGEDYGKIIGFSMPWGDDSSFFALGQYDVNEEVDADDLFFWVTPAVGYDFVEETYLTPDNGTFRGYTAGIWGDHKTLFGSAVALYIDNEQNVGILKSDDITGFVSANEQTWIAGGNWQAFNLNSDHEIEADEFEEYIQNSEMESLLFGNFIDEDGENYLQSAGSGDTWYVYNYEHDDASYPFGIYRLEFENSYETSSVFYNPEDSGDWEGTMLFRASFGRNYVDYGGGGGEDDSDYGLAVAEVYDGHWENGHANAAISGIFLTYTKTGFLDGNFYALYDEEGGSWAGAAIGTFNGVFLDFAADLHEASLYEFDSEDGEFYSIRSNFEVGILGGVWEDTPWHSLAQVTSMSLVSHNEGNTPFLLRTEWGGINVFNDSDLTFDGSGLRGIFAGSWYNGETMGGFYAFYITAAPEDSEAPYEAGILHGFLEGSFYSNPSNESFDGLYYLQGDLEAQRLGFTELDPSALFDESHMITNTFVGRGNGSFVLPGGENFISVDALDGLAIHIENQGDWGIFQMDLGGTYSGNLGASRIAVGAEVSGSESTTALLTTAKLNFEITDNEFGNIIGNQDGIWVSEESDSVWSTMSVGVISGLVHGHYGKDGDSNWQAASIGEWVTSGTTLDSLAVSFTPQDLVNFIQVPFTESFHSTMAGNGHFNSTAGNIQAVAQTSFYSSEVLEGPNKIWTSLIQGTYSQAPTTISSWVLSLTGPSNVGVVNATLNGVEWQDNVWRANVIGNVASTNIAFLGQATGNYLPGTESTNSGTISGVGLGTWSDTTIIPD